MAIIEKIGAEPPYKNGKPTFKSRYKFGVYEIYKDGLIRYVGYSGTDLYKALYRHFQSWNDCSQTRVTYTNLKGIKVKVTYTKTKLQASKLEKALIIKFEPPDNPNQYWLDFDNDKGEQEIYKEYVYKKWRKKKENKADEEEHPF